MDCFGFVLCVVCIITLYKALDWAVRQVRYGAPPDDTSERRNILVTGCDTGFGNLFAKRMSAKGYRVYAGCLRPAGAKKLSEEARGELVPVVMDVSVQSSVANACQLIVTDLTQRYHGHNTGLWAVVNNAGIAGLYAPLEWMEVDEYKATLSVNLFGQIHVIKAFLPLVKKTKGRLVNTASVMGRVAFPLGSAYAISKFGVEAMSDSLRREMRSFSVSVHIVEPGGFKTSIADPAPMVDKLNAKYSTLSSTMQEEYGQEYAASVSKFMKEEMSKVYSSNLDLVVDAYEHAVSAVFPRGRYSVGWDARILLWLVALMPEWMSDLILTQILRLPKPKINRA